MGHGLVLHARCADETLLPVEISLTPLSDGPSPRVIATIVDVSARRAIEEDLRTARGYLQALLDGLPAKVAYWDAETRNRFTNQQYRDWHRIQLKSVEGRHMSDVMGRAAYLESLPHDRSATWYVPRV